MQKPRIVSVSRRTDVPAFYAKVERHLRALRPRGFVPMSFSTAEQVALVNRLAEIAADYGITVYACCQDYLVGRPICKAHCVDAPFLAGLAGGSADNYRRRPSWRGCGCYESVDIGMYDTCPHQCVYCYANNGLGVMENYRRHDPASPLLVTGEHGDMDPLDEVSDRTQVAGWKQQRFPWS